MDRNAWCRRTSARSTSSSRSSAICPAPSRSDCASTTSPADASSQPASSRPLALSRAGVSSVRALRTRAAPAVPSPSTTQVQPNPFASVRRAAGRSSRTTPARRRRWTARRARPPGTLAAVRCARWRRTSRRARRTTRRVRGCQVLLAGLTQPFRGVRPDAVEQPVAHRAVLDAVNADQRAIDQPADRVQHRTGRDTERRQDVLGRIERGAAGEAGQRPQPTLVVGEQQLVAPRDRSRERASSLGSLAVGVAQQREPVIQATADVAHRQ